jgi:exosome complex component RRP42
MRENYIIELLKNDERIDGRKLDEFREISIEVNPISKAEGSARVRMGKTDVIVGVKMDVGTPFPDTPNEGTIRNEAEFTPLASEDFESGPPGEDATELSRVVDRAIRESHSLDLKKLCIQEGEKVWSASIDTIILNHNGNLIDAATLGAMTALLNAKMPKIDGDNIIRGEYSGGLPIESKAVNVTVCKYKDKYIIDPTKEEEEVFDTKICIGVRDDGKIVSMQKIGPGSLTENEIYEIMDIATKKAKDLLKLVKVHGKKDTEPKAKADKSGKD